MMAGFPEVLNFNWLFLELNWILSIIGQDPSVSKSNRLHVDDIFSGLLYASEIRSIDSSKMMGGFPESLELLTGYCLSNSTDFWA